MIKQKNLLLSIKGRAKRFVHFWKIYFTGTRLHKRIASLRNVRHSLLGVNLFFCAILILSLSASGYSTLAKVTTPTASKDTIVVKNVIDGDTISVILSGKKENVRLIGIDAPESTTTRFGYIECFAKESTKYLTSLLSGKKINLIYDDSQGKYDVYNRILAYIFLGGKNINLQMIAGGYAFEYTYNKPYFYQKAFKLAQTNADKNNKGLWNSSACNGDRKKGTTQTTTPTTTGASTNQSHGAFSCSILKKTCAKMISCEEAKYYLITCGVKSLDGDRDGTPCEALCK